MGTNVGVIGTKGGVGTATVTVNTGVALVERGLQVTMVDLRGYFGTMAAHLGVHPGDHPHNLAERLDEQAENISHDSVEQLLFRHRSGMKVLLGAQDGDG
jgi:MinD-like ATPase involved in chromosome partitioning or flagellar assembly